MLVPFFDNVVVKRDKAQETKTAGGLIVPAKSDASNPDTAVVLSAGPGVGGAVKEGDKVVLGKFSGVDVMVDGLEKVTVIALNDILGVVVDEKSDKK